MLQILVVPPTQLPQCLVLLIDRNTLPEKSLLIESFRLGPEVMDQQLQDDRDADVSYFVVLKRVDLLCDESVDRQLKLAFLFSLLFVHILTDYVYPVVYEGGSSFEQFGEL